MQSKSWRSDALNYFTVVKGWNYYVSYELYNERDTSSKNKKKDIINIHLYINNIRQELVIIEFLKNKLKRTKDRKRIVLGLLPEDYVI